MKQYDQGQTAKLTATFRTAAGALFDPDSVTFTIKRMADDSEESFIFDAAESESVDGDVYHPSTGVFYLNVDTSVIGGIYQWRVNGEDAVNPQTAKTGSFYVKPNETGESNMGAWTVEVRKTADQTVTNDDTMTNDLELFRSLQAGDRILFEIDAVYSGNDASADFKFGVAVSSGVMDGAANGFGRSSSVAGAIGTFADGIDGEAAKSFTSWRTEASHATVCLAQVGGLITVSADCVFRVQFAQAVATSAKSVKMLRGSRLRIKKLN